MERNERLTGFEGDVHAMISGIITPGLTLTYQNQLNNEYFHVNVGVFSINDVDTRKAYGQSFGLFYVGAILREEDQKVFMPDCWRIDSGKRIGTVALPRSEIQPLPEEGIKMPDFWWLQLINMRTYWGILDHYGQSVADRYIELGGSGADNPTIITKLKKEFNMR